MFPLVAPSCSLSRAVLAFIVSPSPHDEPQGYVAAEEQNTVRYTNILQRLESDFAVKFVQINNKIHRKELKKEVHFCISWAMK